MSSSKWVRYPDNSRDGLFDCGCGSRIIVCWAPGADFDCPVCHAEYNSSGQRLAPRAQWGEETGEHPADVAEAFPHQTGIVHDPISDLIATAENMLLHSSMSDEDRAARASVIDSAKKYSVSLNHPATDPAAVWYAANSMREYMLSLHYAQRDEIIQRAEGQDNWMRTVAIPAALEFEKWAVTHVDFQLFDDVWGYWLDHNFGELEAQATSAGLEGEEWCKRIAFLGNIPLLCGASSQSAP